MQVLWGRPGQREGRCDGGMAGRQRQQRPCGGGSVEAHHARHQGSSPLLTPSLAVHFGQLGCCLLTSWVFLKGSLGVLVGILCVPYVQLRFSLWAALDIFVGILGVFYGQLRCSLWAAWVFLMGSLDVAV